jgi:hypothetical protein
LEYEVAALLLQEDEPELAIKIVEAIRTRYDGRKQNPWNDIECGDHYVRAMASWSLLEAASGYVYDAAKHLIGFAPAIGPESFRAPFFGHEGWGTVEQKVQDGRQSVSLMTASGSVSVATLRMRPLVTGRQCHVALDKSHIAVQIAETDRDISVELSETVTVERGSMLTVTLSA